MHIITPWSPDELRRNVVSALARGLPNLQPQAPQLVPLSILANGPSARQARPLAPVMAVNGAIRLFTAMGGYPTFWACCDAGRGVADFLAETPQETIYFVASRCHPAVFDALADRQVVVWHVDEPDTRPLLTALVPMLPRVPSAGSVTLCALPLAGLMGFRRVELFGWDGCFDGAASHAVPQGTPQSRVRVSIGGPDGPAYDTTGTWLAEARDAVTVLRGCGLDVSIHGRGMFAAILAHNHVARCRG